MHCVCLMYTWCTEAKDRKSCPELDRLQNAGIKGSSATHLTPLKTEPPLQPTSSSPYHLLIYLVHLFSSGCTELAMYIDQGCPCPLPPHPRSCN